MSGAIHVPRRCGSLGRLRRHGPRALRGVKWKFPTGGRVVASAVARDAIVYFGSDDGNLYAVDAATGRQVWKFATAGPVSSTPAVDGAAVSSPATTASSTRSMRSLEH